LAWSPDGHSLATASDNGAVRLWDTHTFRTKLLLRELRGGHTIWDAEGNLLGCSENAWEHLAWLVPADADHPYGRSLPAEHFGPLPVV
jgi:WD40 repeat protein